MQVLREDHSAVVQRLLCKRFRTAYGKTDLTVAPDPKLYSSSVQFSKDWLLYNYRRKLNGSSSRSIEEATVRSWRDAERHCFATNQRLNQVIENDFFNQVRELIIECIGLEPSNKLTSNGRWSNGATALTKRGTHFSNKMKSVVAVSPRAAKLAPFFFKGLSSYGFGEFSLCRSNRCVQVPKTSKINRMIACEPAANAFMQQAVGRHFRDSLFKVGIDLNDQTNNQLGAFRAAADDLATIDLQMASDTLAFALVRHVLPHSWFTLLCDLRCTHSEIDGTNVLLEKFSSMGNGFTFELESLIFWAVSRVITSDNDILVYGDDIICRQCDAPLLIKGLEYCGFIVNKEKTFLSGSFFESCGKHYFTMDDVTPVYQKEVIDPSMPLTVYRAHNRLFRWGLRNKLYLVQDALDYLLSLLPKKYILYIPICERDDGLLCFSHTSWDTSSGDIRCRILASKVENKPDGCDVLSLAFSLKTGVTGELPKGGFGTTLTKPGVSRRWSVFWRTGITN